MACAPFQWLLPSRCRLAVLVRWTNVPHSVVSDMSVTCLWGLRIFRRSIANTTARTKMDVVATVSKRWVAMTVTYSVETAEGEDDTFGGPSRLPRPGA
ncbi:MAG: hypothetical protein JWN70_4464 [Planctomycetaceae bacterium]|nr:hypothetical protein [Planctomycetaceae bacterium]